MLVLFNVTIESSNLRKKKIKELLYVTKKLSNMILKLHNVIMESSNVRKKNKGTTECSKRIVKCDVGTA